MDGASVRDLTHRLQSQIPVAVSEDALYKAIGDVWNYLQTVLKDGQVSLTEMVTLGAQLAGVVNRFGHLSGVQKQDLVIQILNGVLESVWKRQILSDACYQEVSGFVKTVLPTILTVAVAAARGEIDLKKRSALFSSFGAILQACVCPPTQVVVPSKAPVSQETPSEPKEMFPPLPPSPAIAPVEGRPPTPCSIEEVPVANMEIPRSLETILESPPQSQKAEESGL